MDEDTHVSTEQRITQFWNSAERSPEDATVYAASVRMIKERYRLSILSSDRGELKQKGNPQSRNRDSRDATQLVCGGSAFAPCDQLSFTVLPFFRAIANAEG